MPIKFCAGKLIVGLSKVKKMSAPLKEVFEGFGDHIDKFREILRDVVRGAEIPHGLVVSGYPGSGKSTLLREFQKEAKRERFNMLSFKVPMTNVSEFLIKIRTEILDLSPDTKKKIRTTAPPLLSEDEIIADDAQLEQTKQNFIQGFDLLDSDFKKRRFFLLVFIDNLERFAFREYVSAFEVIKKIAEWFTTNKANILFVFGVLNDYKDLLVSPSLNMMDLKAFSAMESETLIRNVISEAEELELSREETERLNISSGGIPAVLVEMLKGLQEKSLDEVIHSYAESGYIGYLGLDSRSVNMLENIASLGTGGIVNINLVKSMEEIETEELNEIINILKEKGIIEIDDNLIGINSNLILYEILNRGIMSLLGKIELSTLADFPDIKKHKNLALRIIISALNSAKNEVKNDNLNRAFLHFDFAIKKLLEIDDLERAAMVGENAASMFEDKNRLEYARYFLQQAADQYDKAGNIWKKNDLARRSGLMFERQAENFAEEGDNLIARSFFRSAFKLFNAAGDSSRAERSRNRAIESLTIQIYKEEFEKLKKREE